jgi:hypothetical protein
MLKTALLACASFFLFGCSTHLPEPNATVNVEAITYAILTELYCASIQLPGNDGNPYFGSNDNWVGVVDLNLSASIEASANPSVSLLGPFNPSRAVAPNGGTTGTFTSVFSSSIDETRTNLREYKMYIKLPALIKNWRQFAAAHAWPVDCFHPNAGGTFLQGRLDLKGWLAPAVRVQEAVIDFEVLNPPAGSSAGAPAPTISDIYPKNGPARTSVNITGANLPTKNFTVFFGNKSVPSADVKVPDTSGTLITVKAPPPAAPGPVPVTVVTKAGTTATALSPFTYTNESAFAAAAGTGGGGGGASGSSQSPTVSGTFTFQIKTTGTIGPSFTLTRVSGGANNLLTASRTDNNYVNIALTPATYCPIASPVVPVTVPAECALKTATAGVIPSGDLQIATQRLENALLNLNLSHLIQQ